jgi:HK97 family phage prohead protease
MHHTRFNHNHQSMGEEEMINKILNFEIKQIGSDSDRTLEFVGSDETPDRDHDIIEVAGWNLAEYMKNPVFLWAHQHHDLPVGKAINVIKDIAAKKLRFKIKFPTAEEYPFADTVYRMYKGGYLNATSVGFRGVKYQTRNEPEVQMLPEWQRGRRYIEQDLLELSAVPVPANPNALISARSAGIITAKTAKYFEVEDIDTASIPYVRRNEKTFKLDGGGIVTETDIRDMVKEALENFTK